MLMWWIMKNCDTFKHVIIHCSALRKHWLTKMKNEKLQIKYFRFCCIISSFAIWKCHILKLRSDQYDDQSLWCIISFQCHFIKRFGGIISTQHHFTKWETAISFTSLSFRTLIYWYWFLEWEWGYFFNSVQFLRISIWCHFKELGWYHSQISCTFSAAGEEELSSDTQQQSEWKENARERGLEHFPSMSDSPLKVWVDNTHIVAHKEALRIFLSMNKRHDRTLNVWVESP